MKNTFLFVIMLVTGTVLCVHHSTYDDEDHISMPFAQAGVQVCIVDSQYAQILPNERNFRRELYWQDKYNPRYYLFEKFPFAYFISILKDHIVVLENKIASKQDGSTSSALRVGMIVAAMSLCAAYGSHCFYTIAQAALMDPKLPFSEQPQQYQQHIPGAVIFGLLTTALAAIAGSNFYKVYRYAERLLERLERDKRILATLEREKAVVDGQQMNLIDGAVDKLTAKITNSLTSVIQTR